MSHISEYRGFYIAITADIDRSDVWNLKISTDETFMTHQIEFVIIGYVGFAERTAKNWIDNELKTFRDLFKPSEKVKHNMPLILLHKWLSANE